MITVTAPIHTATVNGVPLRFFAGPTGAPDMPWHAHEDLLAALRLPRPLRRTLRAQVLKHWSAVCRTVEVEGEPVLLAPHFVAQGLIGAAQEAGRGIAAGPDIVEREYHGAGVEVMQALTGHLPTAQARAAWAIEAFRNSGQAGDAP